MLLATMPHDDSFAKMTSSKEDESIADDATFGEYTMSDVILEDAFLKNLSERQVPDIDAFIVNGENSALSFSSYNGSMSSFAYESSEEGGEISSVRDFHISERAMVLDGARSFVKQDVANTPPNSTKRKKVRFGKITVRDYVVTIGDSHNVMCPLELSWDYQERIWPSLSMYLSSERRLHDSYHQSQHQENPSIESYVAPVKETLRIPLQERREWIANAQRLQVSDVKLMEMEIFMRNLQQQPSVVIEAGSLIRGNAPYDDTVLTQDSTPLGIDEPPRKPVLKRGSSNE